MNQYPSLKRIIRAVHQLYLPCRKKARQGCKPRFSDELIIALAVYQHLAGFKYANAMLANLCQYGEEVPATSTYSERKKALLGNIILAVKELCTFGERPVRVHMDSKKFETCVLARAKRVGLPGAVGWDHINENYFYGLRLHGTVDDEGWLRRIVIRKANEHDVKVAPRLLAKLSYTVATGDKGYVSAKLKESVVANSVDVISKRRKNQAPTPEREKRLFRHHKRVETAFSTLDNLGLLVRRYRKPWGLVFHLMSVLLADFFSKLFNRFPSFGLLSSPGLLALGYLRVLSRIWVYTISQ